MTTAHWAVIPGSVSLRETAENNLKKSVDGAQQLVDHFTDEAGGVDEDLLQNVNTALTDLEKNITDIQDKIPSQDTGTTEENQQQPAEETPLA
jgi:hypothetical protein